MYSRKRAKSVCTQGVHAVGNPVEDQNDGILLRGLRNGIPEKSGILPLNRPGGQTHNILFSRLKRPQFRGSSREESLLPENSDGIFRKRAPGIGEGDRFGDSRIGQKIIQTLDLFGDLLRSELPQIRMVPGVIADFKPHPGNLHNLGCGQQLPRVRGSPVVVESADEEGRSEAELFQQRRNVLQMADDRIVKCEYHRFFLHVQESLPLKS